MWLEKASPGPSVRRPQDDSWVVFGCDEVLKGSIGARISVPIIPAIDGHRRSFCWRKLQLQFKRHRRASSLMPIQLTDASIFEPSREVVTARFNFLIRPQRLGQRVVRHSGELFAALNGPVHLQGPCRRNDFLDSQLRRQVISRAGMGPIQKAVALGPLRDALLFLSGRVKPMSRPQKPRIRLPVITLDQSSLQLGFARCEDSTSGCQSRHQIPRTA